MSLEDRWTREVIDIVAEIAEVSADKISNDANLEELGVDSLDGLRIVAAVEKRFGVVIEEAQIGSIRTMADIVGLVKRYSSETG